MPRIIKLAQGTYTSSTVTIDGDGRVITAASGSAGGGTYVTTTFTSPGTLTPDPGSQYMFALVAGGGGGNSQNAQGNDGQASNFGNLLTAPGGAEGAGYSPGGGGTYSSNVYWSVGVPSGSTNVNGSPGGRIGTTKSPTSYGGWTTTAQIGSLSGAGSGGNATGNQNRGGGSGGVAAAYYNAPQYNTGQHTITIGEGGTSPGQPSGHNGQDGRAVAIEFVS